MAAEPWLDRAPDTIRIATLNAGMVRKGAGMLVHEMARASAKGGSTQIDAVAEIILRVRPDILLLNKFDRDPAHSAQARNIRPRVVRLTYIVVTQYQKGGPRNVKWRGKPSVFTKGGIFRKSFAAV